MTETNLPQARRTLTELLRAIGQCPADLRAWAETEGYANLEDHIAIAGVISAQAATTLTLLLAGLGGALAFAVKVVEPAASPVAWGAAALCAHLTVLAAVLVARNMHLADAPMLHNQPDSLLQLGASLEQLRMGELVNLEERIRDQRAMNDRCARSLNLVRRAVIAGPLAFAIAALVAAQL